MLFRFGLLFCFKRIERPEKIVDISFSTEAGMSNSTCTSNGDCDEFEACSGGFCECDAGGGTDLVMDVLLPLLVVALM